MIAHAVLGDDLALQIAEPAVHLDADELRSLGEMVAAPEHRAQPRADVADRTALDVPEATCRDTPHATSGICRTPQTFEDARV